MKINTLSPNNPAFGVRIPIKEATVSDLKLIQRLIANPQLDKPADGSIFRIIYDKIMNTTQKNSFLIPLFQNITRCSSEFIGLLEKSGKTLERAFWETCNKFFDVQLVANDEDKNKNIISDAKIKEDSYLIRIFHPQENNREIKMENRKSIIEYCIKNYSEAKNKRDEFCEKIKDKLDPDVKVLSIRENILGPILRLPKYYNKFKKNAIQGKEQTFTEFKEYLEKKAPRDNKIFYNSGNGEFLAYTIETFKKYVPKFKEEFVFAEDTIANINTIGKERKKKTSIEQSSKDAVSFIDYYIDNNIINSKQTTKEIHSALFDTNIESNPNENHVSSDTLQKWKFTINKIKETLEIYPNKTDDEIMNYIKNKCHHKNMCCILTDKKLFSRAINKLRALNKTTNDNTVEKNNDTTQTNINTRASIKRMHELDSSESKAMDSTEKNNDVPLQADEFRNDNIIELVSADSEETTNDNIVEKNNDTTQTNINTRASIKRTHELDSSEPKAMDNTEKNDEAANEKQPHLAEKPVSDSFKSPFDILYEQLFLQNKDNKREVFNTKDTSDEINMFETKRQHLFPNQGAPILPNLNNNSNNVQQKNVYEIHTNNIKKNNVAKKRERHEIDLQARKMMIAYSLFKSKDLKLCKAREITNNIKNDLNITVTGNSMYNTLGPMHKLVDIYNKFKIDDNCKDLPKTIEIFHAYVMKVIDEYLKDKPIINDKSMFYFTVAAMANVFEGKIQFENSLNLEKANKDVKKYFDELKNKGIKNETKYITY